MQVNKWDFSATGTGGACGPTTGNHWSAQLTCVGTGTVAAVVRLEGTNDPTVSTSWQTILTLEATSGASPRKDMETMAAGWAYVRAVCDSISGTGAVAYATVSTR